MSAIMLNEVTIKYRHPATGTEITALDQLSLEVSAGEIYGFAGLNGAGKTTAIKVLLGLARPDSGVSSILEGSSAAVSAQRIGFAPEISDLPGFLTVTEVLEYACVLCGVDAADELVRRAIGLLDLSREKGRRVNLLSKGLRQRVSLAAAIVHRPELVILDEPSSGLDPIARKLVKTLIKQLNDEGATVFFSTHILSDLPGLCSRIGLINRGKLIFCGTPDSLSSRVKSGDLEESFEEAVRNDNQRLEPGNE